VYFSQGESGLVSIKGLVFHLDPVWASVNLVVCVCAQCIGVHRKLGVHSSKPRSLLMDLKIWTPSLVRVNMLTLLNNTPCTWIYFTCARMHMFAIFLAEEIFQHYAMYGDVVNVSRKHA
jgi:hypothetical protein